MLALPDYRFAVSEETLGKELFQFANSVIEAYSNVLKDQLNSGGSFWDGTAFIQESEKIKNLIQKDGITKVEPERGWICEEAGCGLKENLWINLTDGVIKCGRPQYGLPYGGNGHAKEHAKQTGYHLILRLATIENGEGEVFQYDFDTINGENECFVKDTKLKEHMAKFGLNLDNFKKTEKGIVELEYEKNMFVFYKI